MSDRPRKPKHRRLRIALRCVGLVAAAVGAVVVVDQVGLRSWREEVASSDAAVRGKALHHLGKEREVRAAEAIHAALREARDRATAFEAGYAAMRVRDKDGIALLRQRADALPDDKTRAELIVFAARLADRDPAFDAELTAWMTAGLEAAGVWRRVGSAVGLLYLGKPIGGERLVSVARGAEPEVQAYAVGQFRDVVGPMAEAIGQPITAWPGAKRGSADDPRWDVLATFWQRYGTDRLLNDVLTRLHRHDPKWHELKRLRHARDRVTEWIE